MNWVVFARASQVAAVVVLVAAGIFLLTLPSEAAPEQKAFDLSEGIEVSPGVWIDKEPVFIEWTGCRSARKAVVHYRNLTWDRQDSRGAPHADRTPIARGKSCYWVQYAAEVHAARALTARRALERHTRLLEDPDYAIEVVFGPRAAEAKNVAGCESGDTDGDLSPHVVRAENGQYLGMFQMGSWERSVYGHGGTPYAQAIAAHRYFVDTGSDWSPWSCSPWG